MSISAMLKLTDIFEALAISVARLPVAEFDAVVVQPGDGETVLVEGGFAQNRVVAAAVECD